MSRQLSEANRGVSLFDGVFLHAAKWRRYNSSKGHLDVLTDDLLIEMFQAPACLNFRIS